MLALKMALDGAPREDTARYLRENFTLDDPDSLLDEVYAQARRAEPRASCARLQPTAAGEAISTRLPSGSRT